MKKIAAVLTFSSALALTACGLDAPALADRKGKIIEFDYDAPTYKSCKTGTGCVKGKKLATAADWDITIISDRTGEELEIEVSESVYNECLAKKFPLSNPTPKFDGESCK
jgi:hypothetical protein